MTAMFLLALQQDHSNQQGASLSISVPPSISYNCKLRRWDNDVSFPAMACALCKTLVNVRYMCNSAKFMGLRNTVKVIMKFYDIVENF